MLFLLKQPFDILIFTFTNTYWNTVYSKEFQRSIMCKVKKEAAYITKPDVVIYNKKRKCARSRNCNGKDI